METKEKLICVRCNEKPATEIQQIFKKGKLNNAPVCKECGKDWGKDNFFKGE